VRFYLRLNFLEGSDMLQNRLAVVIGSTVFLVAGSLTALAQGLVTQKLISADQAHTIARGAVDKCRADGYHVTVTVIDEDGLLKAFLRDDGSAPHTIDFSRKKAYSALTFRRTSAETGKAWADNPPAPNVDGTTGTAGGVPIKAGGVVIGAVGVSGAPGGDKDEACANAGIAKIAADLK
jgi:uncharacterized protein GlcG (DUF336 family)